MHCCDKASRLAVMPRKVLHDEESSVDSDDTTWSSESSESEIEVKPPKRAKKAKGKAAKKAKEAKVQNNKDGGRRKKRNQDVSASDDSSAASSSQDSSDDDDDTDLRAVLTSDPGEGTSGGDEQSPSEFEALLDRMAVDLEGPVDSGILRFYYLLG